MTQVTSAHLGESLGTDFFSVREQFTDEQWTHFITVRRFVDEEVVPVVGPYWERAEILLAAGQAAARARHRRRGHPGIRLCRDEPDGVRAGHDGTAPR